ncbi:MAG: tRNA-dihydrouridine synthase [Bacteroidales bacterium]
MDSTTNLSMAPFRGITTRGFRHAFARHIGGCDQLFAPFVSGTGTKKVHPEKLSDLLPPDEQIPVVPQVLSNNAEEIILLGNTLYDHGFTNLNWNLGCPFSRIAHKKKGSGILPHPDLLDRLLDKIFSEIRIGFSVKTRLGYHHPEEIGQIWPVLNRYPLLEVILHPRTGKQLYRGQADPQAFARWREECRHPLVYNGDIANITVFRNFHKLFPGQTRWMPGRGILTDPFLALSIKNVLPEEKIRRKSLADFHQALQESATSIPGEAKQLGWMKAIWHYLSGSFANSAEVSRRIKRSRSLKTYRAAVDYAFQQRFSDEEEKALHFRSLTR